MRLHHHAIVVHDMDQAIRTFCERLGMTLVGRYPGKGQIPEVAFVEEPQTGHRMELLLNPQGEHGRLDHIAFEVDDVDVEFQRLTASGLTAADEPTDVPQGDFLFQKIHSSSCRLAHLLDDGQLKLQIVRYD